MATQTPRPSRFDSSETQTHSDDHPGAGNSGCFVSDLSACSPSFRACDSPIAIACFLLVTFLPDLPLFSDPSFRSCIAFSTFFDAFLPYLAILLPPSSRLYRL